MSPECLDCVSGQGSVVDGVTVLIFAAIVGYYVVWGVTPALHSPLMSVTNAVSSVIIVGAIIAAGPARMDMSTWVGLIAVGLAMVNIFGGFIVTWRMLSMFRSGARAKSNRKKPKSADKAQRESSNKTDGSS